MFRGLGLAAGSALAAAACLAVAGSASAGVAAIDQIAPSGSMVALDVGAAAPAGASQIDGIDTNALLLNQAPLAGGLVEQSWADDRSLIVQDGGLDGSGLYAEVHQTAPGAQSEIFQSGAMNTAIVYQTMAAGSVSSIVQSGFGNSAVVSQ